MTKKIMSLLASAALLVSAMTGSFTASAMDNSTGGNFETEVINSFEGGDRTLSIISSEFSKTSNKTVCGKLELKNTSDQRIDLSKVKIRYYFTFEKEETKFDCDYAGVYLNSAPYLLNVSDVITADFVAMENPVPTANNYVDISLENVPAALITGETMTIHYRLTSKSWFSLDFEDDYSYINGYTLFYDNSVLSGDVL